MSEFVVPSFNPDKVRNSVHPDFKKTVPYKRLEMSGQLDIYYAQLGGLVEASITLRGQGWRAAEPTRLLHLVQYEEVGDGEYHYTTPYKELMELVLGRKIAVDDEGTIPDRDQAAVWKSFTSVVEVAKSGALSWQEYLEKNKPGKPGLVTVLPGKLAI